MSLYDDFVKSKAQKSILYMDSAAAPDFDAYKPSTVVMPAPKTPTPVAAAPAAPAGSLYAQFQAQKSGTASPIATTTAPAEPAQTSFFEKAKSLLTGYSDAVMRKAVPLVAGTAESVGGLVRSVQWLGDRLIGDPAMQKESEKVLQNAVQQNDYFRTALAKQLESNRAQGKDSTALIESIKELGFRIDESKPGNLGPLVVTPDRLPQSTPIFSQTVNTEGFATKTQQVASSAASFLKKEAGITPENQTFAERAIEGLGSSLPYFIPGVGIARAANAVTVAPRIAMLFGNVTSSALESMAEAGAVYDEVEKTQGEQAAMEASMRTFLANAVVLTITERIGIFNPNTGSALKKALLSAPSEGIQEGLQQMISNNETNRPLWEGVLESTAIGAIVGGVLGPSVDLVALNSDIVNHEMDTPIFKAVAEKAYKATLENGGVTIDLQGNSPDGGFVYSPSKETETIVPKEQFNDQVVAEFMDKHAEALSIEGNHVGIWESDGKMYLDVSRVGELNEQSIEDAMNAQQLAGFDLSAFEEVPLGKIENDVYTRLYDKASSHPYLNKGQNEGASSAASDVGVQEVPVDSAKGTSQAIETPKPAPGDAQSRVFERLKAEHPEELRGKLTYETINLEEQAQRAVKLIEADKQKAFRIAMGAEASTDVTSTAVNIAMAEAALESGNVSLYTRLVKNRSLAQTRRGQEIVSEKGSVSDNDTSRFVKELIAQRIDYIGGKYLKSIRESTGKKVTPKEAAINQIDKEVRKAKERLSSRDLDLNAAQALIDSLAC